MKKTLLSIKLKLKEIRKKFYLEINRIRILVSFRIRDGKFNILLNDKFESQIKKVSKFILLASITISFIAIPFPLSAYVSIILIILDQLIERVIFSFVSFTLVPFPDFELWKKANFIAVILGMHKLKLEPATVGMFFGNEDAGKQVFEFISNWNYSNRNDLGKGNIHISFIIDEGKGKYAFFAYPSLQRPSLKKHSDNIKQRKASIGKEQIDLVAQMIICKLFNYNNSALKLFRENYVNGDQYYFLPFSGTYSNPQPIKGVMPISKDYLRILDRNKLTKKDLEYFMSENNINWDDDTKVPESIFSYR